jgi:hypothetical protein
MATAAQLQRTFGVWSAASLIGGAALWAGGRHEPVRKFGRQTFGWGVVNAAIAGWAARRPTPDTERLRKILMLNAVADVGYVSIGALMHRKGLRPDGAAVIVQGAFLLALDTHFAYHLPHAEA